ncbi:type II secretion system F family protein [Micromonospora sp. CPCC 206060]|uniref:type II secretion system F family protein n=1 Tax=Micromonospora sp. CPCC 206060 TaxID=3122406 RepID=UPI003FA52C1A
MTGSWWLAVACLGGAALAAGWPQRGRLHRLRQVTARRPEQSFPGRRPDLRILLAGYRRHGRRGVLLVALLAGLTGLLVAGPVAGFALAAYGALAARAGLRRVTIRETEQARRRQLDQLCALAADLRAGLPASALPTMPAGDPSAADRLTGLTHAAVRLAERTGAPLADLIERIEADARSTARGLAAAAAQAAGARATAWLLAALPAGGIALGYGIGVDPLRVLLHTPVGAACAIGAVVLQIAGLAWAERLSGAPARTV